MVLPGSMLCDANTYVSPATVQQYAKSSLLTDEEQDAQYRAVIQAARKNADVNGGLNSVGTLLLQNVLSPVIGKHLLLSLTSCVCWEQVCVVLYVVLHRSMTHVKRQSMSRPNLPSLGCVNNCS